MSIDKAISENSRQLAMVHAHFQWSDVGEWRSIWSQLSKDSDGISTINKTSKVAAVNSKNCLVHTSVSKLTGLVGLNNLAIIDTPDALLVCNLSDSFSVRDLVGKIVADPKLKGYFLSKK